IFQAEDGIRYLTVTGVQTCALPISIGVYGIILSGWSSNSKYAFLGALRSAAQLISYEVSIGLVVLPVAIFAGSFNLIEIVAKQEIGRASCSEGVLMTCRT